MMKIMRQRLFFAVGLLAAVSAFAQPAVSEGGILTSAFRSNPRLPNGGVAQGSLFSIYGAGLGPSSGVGVSSLPLQQTLAGTSIRVTSGGMTINCFPIFTIQGQVNAILPSNTPVGNATLVVTFNGASSVARSFRVVASSFGTFSANGQGFGPGSITNFESATAVPLSNSVLRSARPGQTLTLFGTGLGPLPAGTPDNAAAPAVQIGAANIELYVGNIRANVAYAGRAPGFVGLDQINFVVPTGLLGCSIPVYVRIGQIISNFTTIAISAAGGACSDPLGLSSSQLDRLVQTGSLKVGSIVLARLDFETSVPGFGNFNLKSDSGLADFVEYTPQTIEFNTGTNVGGVTSFGTCYVFSGTATDTEVIDPIALKQLDAGSLINVSGPKGAKTLKKSANSIGLYSESFGTSGLSIPGFPGMGDTSYLEAGNYTFNNGAGGADVRGFNANLTIAGALNWTNKATTTTVSRAQGLTVNWTGADPSGYVVVFGYSSIDASTNSTTVSFVCTERGSAGTFTVPPQVLLALPPTPTGSAALDDAPFGALALSSGSNPVSFTAPGLDVGTIVNTSAIFKTVIYN